MLISVFSCSPGYRMMQHSSHTYTIDTVLSADNIYVKMLAPYKDKMQLQMSEVVGYTDTVLVKGRPEGTLGHFVADAMLAEAKKANPAVLAAIGNAGGIRISNLGPGSIILGKIYELMPYDNELVIVQLRGDVLQQFCNHIAANGGWPVSGISFTMKDKKAVNVLVDGKAIQADRKYIIATNDYLLYGGDNCSFVIGSKAENTGRFIRDILIDDLKRGLKDCKPLHPINEKRIGYAE